MRTPTPTPAAMPTPAPMPEPHEPSTASETPDQNPPAAPTRADIHKAIEALVALSLSMDERPSDPSGGAKGDVIVEYHIRMSTPGKKSCEIKGRRIAHRILVEMGIPEAPSILSETLDELTRPLRNCGMAWINDVLKEIKASENPASISGKPRAKSEKPSSPNFM